MYFIDFNSLVDLGLQLNSHSVAHICTYKRNVMNLKSNNAITRFRCRSGGEPVSCPTIMSQKRGRKQQRSILLFGFPRTVAAKHICTILENI